MRIALSTLLLISGWIAASPARASGPEGDDLFTTEVRPILARHCLKCHGPDDKARKGKLRLDLESSATHPAASGARAIVPGDVEESELIARILSDDPNEVMPPPQAKNPLTDAEKQTLKRWISSGARYREHWAFVAPTQPPLPKVKQEGWPKNAIDFFILSRLEAEGLAPRPEADRATLLRRVSLDLIGLPPTPEEARAFLDDKSPNAYASLVDRLLNSPHYGERWARRWLDLARYSDTNGYEKDRPRSIWPYRDWVIDALNRDMPFHQFTLEQIAGDMLPNPTPSQRIATGFHRNTMLNEEGGIDPLEFRFYAMNDRVATTGTTWLGLTVGCAQCHTHKFDPITHRDYYSFMALMDNTEEPEIAIPSADVEARRAEIDRKISALIADLPGQFAPAKLEADAWVSIEMFVADLPTRPSPRRPDPAVAAYLKDLPRRISWDWLAEEGKRPAPLSLTQRRRLTYDRAYAAWLKDAEVDARRWRVLQPKSAESNLPKLVIEKDGVVLAVGDQSKRDVYTLAFAKSGRRGIASIRLDVLPDESLPQGGPGRVYYEGPHGDFFLSEIHVSQGGKPVKIKSASQSFAGNGPAGASAAIDGDPQTGWTISGGQGREHSAVFHLGEPLNDSGNLRVELVFERYYAAGLGKFRILATEDTEPVPARETPFEIETLLKADAKDRTRAQRDRLRREFLLTCPELKEARRPIDAAKKSLPAPKTTLAMKERPPWNPRATFIHNRGEYLQPTDRVDPAVLSILPQLPPSAPKDRLAFARWLVSPENPLTGRVTVNRQWAAFFGTGLVRTLDDFGYQGEAPSHPALLDWLAVEFMKTGSLKSLHRTIVLSASYRQDSRATPDRLAKDAKNRLISRGPRLRLDAESIRDQALRVGGLLSPKVGGPSVFPPQPASVAAEGTYGGAYWKVSEGEDRYRRGLYTFSKRTKPYAMFMTFDAPSGEVCQARREVSNTPLQALMLLNDPVFEEVARALGRHYAKASGTVEARVDDLFRRCLVRSPDPEEQAQLVAFYRKQAERLRAKELNAEAIAGKGDGDPAERALWSILARAILNLDETVTRG